MKLIVAIAALGAAFLILQYMTARNTNQTEQPDYEVLYKGEGFEIRKYPKLIIATTQMPGSSYNAQSGSAFRVLAGYIFGGNKDSEKIAMTSPVQVNLDEQMSMSFIMPSKYRMDNLPSPNNQAVKFSETNGKIMAALTFGGFASDVKIEAAKEKLGKLLEKNNIQSLGSFMFFGYNPPYQLVARRNEIVVEVNYRQP